MQGICEGADTMTRNVLVIDDETNMRWVLAKALEQAGYTAHAAAGGDEGLTILSRQPIELVLLDLKLRGEDGLTVLRRLRERRPDLVVMMLTAHGTVPNAVEAMQLGAADFLRKPFDVEEIVFKVARALERRAMQQELSRLNAQQRSVPAFEHLIGVDPNWQRLVAQARQLAPQTEHVLVVGEAGSGRTSVARAVYAASTRAQGRLVEVDLETLNNPLDVVGKTPSSIWNQAIGGTLLLRGLERFPDVQLLIAERLEQQDQAPRLLIVIDQQSSIAQPLVQYLPLRLSVPPLRERPNDILLLALHFSGKQTLSPQAASKLEQYTWLGNVAELQAVVERACLLAGDSEIDVAHLPRVLSELQQTHEAVFQLPEEGLNLEALEQDLIRQALDKARGNKSRAADLLGLTRHTLLYRLEKYGINVAEKS